MKRFKIISIALIALLTVSSCGSGEQESETATTEISSENLIAADYAVEGMVCQMGCAGTIQEELLGMKGVSSCEVDFKSGKAHVEFDKSQLKEKDIIAKIESLADGKYKVGEWTKEKEEVLEDTVIEGEESDSKENTVTEVSLPTFGFPNLLELLIDQL